MTEKDKDTFMEEAERRLEEANTKQAEYERRRSVWRYIHNLPGPQLPPCEADALWLNGPAVMEEANTC